MSIFERIMLTFLSIGILSLAWGLVHVCYFLLSWAWAYVRGVKK